MGSRRGAAREAADKERYDKIIEYTNLGMPISEIARCLEISTRAVQRCRHKFGLSKPHPGKLTDDEVKRAEQMFDDGCSATEVARTLGRYPSTIWKHWPDRVWNSRQTWEYNFMMRELGKKVLD